MSNLQVTHYILVRQIQVLRNNASEVLPYFRYGQDKQDFQNRNRETNNNQKFVYNQKRKMILRLTVQNFFSLVFRLYYVLFNTVGKLGG